VVHHWDGGVGCGLRQHGDPGHIRIEESGTGDFQFGIVTGSTSGYVEEVGTESRFTFTWEGREEMDPAS